MSAKRYSPEEVEAFCQHYARGGNQSAAVRHAFMEARDWPSDKAWKRAWKLMQRPIVKARIEELRAEYGEAPPPSTAPRRRATRIPIMLSLDDLEVLARASADATTDSRLRLVLARIVSGAISEIGRRTDVAEKEPTATERNSDDDAA